MKNYLKLLFLFMIFSGILINAQALHQIAAGDSTLAAAIKDAAPGDVIELTTDGGLYTNPNQIVISKDLTIFASDQLANKPVIMYTGSNTGAYMFKVDTTANLLFKGLDFAGDGTNSGGAALAKYIFRIDTEDTTTAVNLKIMDCVLHDTQDKMIKPYPLSGIDSIIVHNSTFYNGGKEAIVLYSGSTSDPQVYLNYAEIVNCTFYNIVREAVKGDTNPNSTALIDHCTMYDVGNGEQKAFVYFDDFKSVVVSNSIFQNNNETGNFIRLEGDGSFVNNCIVWDVDDWEIDNATVTDTLHVDPLFADTTNADFTLQEGSIALVYSADGKPIGDLKWAPKEPVVRDPMIVQVAEGDSTLAEAIKNSVPGDVIELITDGGLYTNPNQIVLSHDLRIVAHEQLVNKPVIMYTGDNTGAYMFKVDATANLEFKGLDFAGDGTNNGAAALAKYIFRIDTEDSTSSVNLKVMDCMLHDTQDKMIKPYPLSGIDSIIVHNSVFYNGGSEAIVLYSGSTSDPQVYLDYAEVINCTFYAITREAIKGDTNPNSTALIDHCTMYDIGGLDKAFVYFDDFKSVVVSNSIFQRNNETGNFIRLEGDGSYVMNSIVWDVTDWEIDNATVTDTLHVDPMYTDPANADFTLKSGSPAIGFGTDGKTIGDPRWDPNIGEPVVHKIDEGTDVLKAAIDAANPGDVIELTSSGGMYLSNDQIELDKDLTIRAREGLAEKPVLKYVGTETGAYMFKIPSTANIMFEGLEFDGDGTNDGGAALAKYIVIIRTDDSTTAVNLKIDDCILHDTQDKMIKPYGLSGVDSIIVHNSVFYNGGSEAIVLYSGSTSDPQVYLDYAEVINCTFYAITREAVKGDTNPNSTALIDHCTMYDIGGLDKAFVYFDDFKSVVVSNSIFQRNNETGNFIRLEGDGSYVMNSIVWDVTDWEIDNATVTDTLHVDPLYMDPTNANFVLASNSPARTLGAGGTPIGDLRWAIDPNSVLLSVETVGSGIVQLDPAGGIYSPGTEVTMTAVPDLGWEFEGWEGISVFPPNKNPHSITVNDNVNVTAKFKNLTPQVSLVTGVIGLGTVTVDPLPGEDETYDEGQEVTLTATPEADWVFVEWLGDYTGTDNPATVKVDSNMSVKASFQSTLTQYTLTLGVEGKGEIMVNPEPVIATYDSGAVVVLTALAAKGWGFETWAGDLTSVTEVDSVVMTSDLSVTAKFIEDVVPGGVLEITTNWDLMDAVEYANNNSTVHTLKLMTSGGVYTTKQTGTVSVRQPLSIIAAEGLENKPIITNSDPDGVDGSIDILRVYDSIHLEGVIIDGSTQHSAGMKYGVRYSNGTAPDTVRWGANATFKDVDFIHLYDDGKATGDGHAFKIDVQIVLGFVEFEGCSFYDIGYEAIRISDTEKWATSVVFDSMVVRNCTFTEIDAEGIRYYSDLDPTTPDSPVRIEHCTFNSSATRTMYLKNSGGAIVRDLIIANPRTSGHGRDTDLMDSQGNTDSPSYVSNILLFNVPSPDAAPLKAADGEIDEATIWNFDPMFEDAANMNYTLLASSHAYGLASDGEAMGDLRWATNTPTHVSLMIDVSGNGEVMASPEPVGKTYDPNTQVTLTAVADSGYSFVDWSGDVTSTDNPVNVTLDVSKSVTATFDVASSVDESQIPEDFNLAQNYPNPFNPTTTIKFGLPVSSSVTVSIYNVLGQEVARLLNDTEMQAGFHSVIWNSNNNLGGQLSSGIYIYRIKAVGENGKDFSKTMKMMFLK
ncbi:MAG: DUF5123 domain-containing protein [Melioribacteraceae bacterium]|nr:DUF5123 domain-containing protein [Melioribacteraceae bacterium]